MNLNALKMKNSALIFAALLAAAICGCSESGNKTGIVRSAAASPRPIVTPNYSLAARVISVNIVGRFVVLSFPTGQMPKVEQTLFLYRGGLKVAEVHVTGPQQDSNIVADLISGEAQVGDAVRDQ